MAKKENKEAVEKAAASELKAAEATAEKLEKAGTAESKADVQAEGLSAATPAEKSEPKAPEFIADEKAPKSFAAYKQIKAGYTDEQALNLLRKRIYGYKEIHERFLKRIEEPDAFAVEKTFVAVYCAKSDVRYEWKTAVEKEEIPHVEVRTEEKSFTGANAELNAMSFQRDGISDLQKPKKKAELLPGDKLGFDKVRKSFDKCVKKSAPDKKCKILKRGEAYEVVYVPVMKATCSLDGESYVGYVNLHNGASYSAYKVSERLEKAVDKTIAAVRSSKQSLIGSCCFALTFCVLAMLNVLYPEWDFGAITMDTAWVAIVLAAIAALPLVCSFCLVGYKKQTMIDKSVKTGKLPNALLARVAMAFGWLCCIGAAVLFFFCVMAI